jgi:hypothetical protein
MSERPDVGRFVGHYACFDGIGHHRRIDTALRTHVASFHGPFMAEKEGGDLRIHMLHDEMGRPVQENVLQNQEGTSGIRSSARGGRDAGGIGGISTVAELNALNSKHYAGVGVMRRRGA